MQNLKITLIQTHLHWEQVEANLLHFTQKINSILEQTDVIVLPEMFTTGFSIDREKIAEEPMGQGFRWMQHMAQEKNSDIVGSIAVKENGILYNRLYWVKPDGTFQFYNKRHLFRMAGENNKFSPGQEKIIVEVKGWKICPLVCYDLRFPVWSRNKWNANNKAQYDVLLYVANWPEVRSYPWKQLLIARAIENQSFVVGVNRIGADGNNYPHSGDSCLLSPKGELLSTLTAHQDAVETIEINYSTLSEFRAVFPVGMDADHFNIS